MNNKFFKSVVCALLVCAMMSVTVFASGVVDYGAEYTNQPTQSYSQTFKDVNKNYWAFNYIEEMVSRGVLSGYPNGYFYPDNTVSRAEFAKIMCLAAGINVESAWYTEYADVYTSDWYTPYINAGRYYLSGYVVNGEKMYMPENMALREDIAVALVKLKGYSTDVYDESILKAMFKDYQSISQDARKYVAVAVDNGLISGYEDNTFRGQNTITRAEAATLLWRAYQYGNGNKVFEKEVIDEPEPVKPVKDTKPQKVEKEPDIEPEDDKKDEEEKDETPEIKEPETPKEPEYRYELDTIAYNVSNVRGMVDAGDKIAYLNDNKTIMAVDKDGNHATEFFSVSEIPYLGDPDTPKAKKNEYIDSGIIFSIGYSKNDKCLYAIIFQPGGSYKCIYIYNVTNNKVIGEIKEIENDLVKSNITAILVSKPSFIFDKNNDILLYSSKISLTNFKMTEYVDKSQEEIALYVDNIHFKSFRNTIDSGRITYINNRTGEKEILDVSVSGVFGVTGNSSKICMISKSENSIYFCDSDGNAELECTIDDVNNIDEKPIDFSEIWYYTSTMDDDDTIYYWDASSSSIRKLYHV